MITKDLLCLAIRKNENTFFLTSPPTDHQSVLRENKEILMRCMGADSHKVNPSSPELYA